MLAFFLIFFQMRGFPGTVPAKFLPAAGSLEGGMRAFFFLGRGSPGTVPAKFLPVAGSLEGGMLAVFVPGTGRSGYIACKIPPTVWLFRGRNACRFFFGTLALPGTLPVKKGGKIGDF